jgi:cell division protein FtsW
VSRRRDLPLQLRHDHALLGLVLALLVAGIGVLYSASQDMAAAATGDGLRFVKRQLVNAAVGMAALLVVSRIDYRRWRRAARFLLFCACIGLGVVFLFEAVRGARAWVPVLGRSLQPVEFVRVTLVLFLASELVRRGPEMASLRRGYLPLVAVVGAILLVLLKQNDSGSAMALGLITFTLLYAGGARVWHLAVSTLVVCAGGVVVALHKPHIRDRVLAWVHPSAHAHDVAYQSLQSVLSIGSGGIFGKGLGQGLTKLGYIPDPHTDFVFSVMGEELGFAGCVVVLGLFLLLVARAIRVARAQEDPFAQLVAVGMGMSIFWYVVVNVMVATRLFPVTGLPLPFVSYGGSSLVSHLIAVGILINIARSGQPPPPRPRFARPVLLEEEP